MRDLLVVYLTKSGNTRLIAEAIARGAALMDMAVEALSLCDIIPGDIIQAKVIAIGSPTYEQRMLSPVEKLLESLEYKDCRGKLGVAFGSYGWSGEAPLMIARRMRELGFLVLDPVMRVQYRPNDKDIEACELLGKGIALKLKRSLLRPGRW